MVHVDGSGAVHSAAQCCCGGGGGCVAQHLRPRRVVRHLEAEDLDTQQVDGAQALVGGRPLVAHVRVAQALGHGIHRVAPQRYVNLLRDVADISRTPSLLLDALLTPVHNGRQLRGDTLQGLPHACRYGVGCFRGLGGGGAAGGQGALQDALGLPQNGHHLPGGGARPRIRVHALRHQIPHRHGTLFGNPNIAQAPTRWLLAGHNLPQHHSEAEDVHLLSAPLAHEHFRRGPGESATRIAERQVVVVLQLGQPHICYLGSEVSTQQHIR
mmetsp:Transcript_21165/g.63682  ORF Transcript_21165/g.63682 Transcript_21165/m.63682 type:complete len:269 (+) Transcript_21165:997-1803(+)